MEYILKSTKDTDKLAKKIASKLVGGEIIVLSGDLGAGKTTFTKGLCKALKIKENVTSPTFTLMNIYESGRLKLYHFDMYRIEDESEAMELGLNEFFAGNGVCVIEWAENIKHLLPKNYIKITITKLGETQRKFLIEGLE